MDVCNYATEKGCLLCSRNEVTAIDYIGFGGTGVADNCEHVVTPVNAAMIAMAKAANPGIAENTSAANVALATNVDAVCEQTVSHRDPRGSLETGEESI